MYTLEITSSCRNINFEKIYAIFGVNVFYLKSWLCKICDIYKVCVTVSNTAINMLNKTVGNTAINTVNKNFGNTGNIYVNNTFSNNVSNTFSNTVWKTVSYKMSNTVSNNVNNSVYSKTVTVAVKA